MGATYVLVLVEDVQRFDCAHGAGQLSSAHDPKTMVSDDL